MRNLLAILAVILMAGCASKDEVRFDKTERAATKSVEVFHFDAPKPLPDRRYEVIAELMFLGPRQDEKKARSYFIHRAKQLGADAVIIIAPEGIGMGGNNLQFNESYYHKAKAVVYK